MEPQSFEDDFPGTLASIPEGGVAFIPNRLPPSLRIDRVLRDAHDSALLALGGLRQIVPFLPNPQLLRRPFLQREAVLSSRIEGTWVGMQQLCLFEVEDADRPGKGRRRDESQDMRQVSNYLKALQHGLEGLSALPICSRLLKGIHERLWEGVPGQDKKPGQFRQTQNFIGRDRDIRTARYVPPPAAAVHECMHDLELYIHQANDDYPILVRLALIHYQFEAIHPFVDGNGRLGRLLISLWLAAKGILPEPMLYLSAYLERNRDAYVRLLWEISRRGAWSEWILFFLEGVRHEAEDACQRAKRLLDLRERYRRAIQPKGSAALLALIDHLFGFPAITVPAATRLLQMTYNGAQNNIRKLQKEGILEAASDQKRNRVFVARDILAILDSDLA